MFGNTPNVCLHAWSGQQELCSAGAFIENTCQSDASFRALTECCNFEVIFPRLDIEEQLNQCDSQSSEEEVLPVGLKINFQQKGPPLGGLF